MFSRLFARWLVVVGLAGLVSSIPAATAATAKTYDLVLVERALARAQAGENVQFGDVGIALWQLQAFRDRLVAEQHDQQWNQIDADTPPGTAFKWPGGVIPYRF